jgi:hypothetical protein
VTALDQAAAANGVVWNYLTLDVLTEDGRYFRAECDQRDMRVAALRYKLDPDTDPLGYAIGTAHACLTRTVEVADTWPEWQKICMFAQPADEQKQVDPTGPAPAG